MLDTAGARGNTSCSAGRTTAKHEKHSASRDVGQLRAANQEEQQKEAEGRRRTEGIIVHAHSLMWATLLYKHFPNT